jgi:hypothetical protein
MYCPTTSTMDTINVGSGAEVYSVNLTELSALSDSGIMPGGLVINRLQLRVIINLQYILI